MKSDSHLLPPAFPGAGRISTYRSGLTWNQVSVFIFSVTYGYVLSKLPNSSFNDFNNYLVVAEFAPVSLLKIINEGFLPFLSNEPIWLLINTLLALVFEPEDIVRLIIFLSAFAVAHVTLRSNPKNWIWLLLILLYYPIVKNFLVHLRQGTAIAIFLLGWFSVSRNSRIFLITLSPFIHSSFFFIIFLTALCKLFKKFRLGADITIPIFIAAGGIIGTTLMFLASLLGARQAEEYASIDATSSGLGFIFWSLICVLFLSQGRNFVRRYLFEISFLLFYLGAYFFTTVTSRVFDSALLLVLLAGLALNGWRRMVYQSSMLIFMALMWIMRVGQPSFGFSEF